MAHEILIIDDEEDIRTIIADILSDEGYITRTAKSRVDALENLKKCQPHLVVLDVWLGESDKDGLQLLDFIKQNHSHLPVIMISGHGTIETAVTAIKNGAYDFIEKPFQTEKLLLVIRHALESSTLKRENKELKLKAGYVPLCTYSDVMQKVVTKIEKIAEKDQPVFISGPLGGGKEATAREINRLSNRSDKPFLVLNCSKGFENELELALWGTTLQQKKIGLIENANRGTLLLKNIGDLPTILQQKLVYFMKTGSFKRIGEAYKTDANVRLIASSESSLEDLKNDNLISEDLYYLFSLNTIHIPPLYKRTEDITKLAQDLLKNSCKAKGETIKRFSADALALMESYDWPGNIRQLKNVVEWLLLMQPRDKLLITADYLPDALRTTKIMDNNVVVLPLREARDAFEKEYLLTQVKRFSGNISKTAEFIGMDRTALHRKLKNLSK